MSGAVAPRIGGTLVAAWLAGIIANLVIIGFAEGEYWDIALRDFGLMIGAATLAILAVRYGPLARREGGPPAGPPDGAVERT